MNPRCPRCGRPVWYGDDGAITEFTCHHQDGTVCKLVAQRDALLGAIRRIPDDSTANHDVAVRTAKAVADRIQCIAKTTMPCPLCGSYDAVRKGAVVLHFAKVTDTRPCPASLKNLGALK